MTGQDLATVFSALRSLVVFGLLSWAVWFAFTVNLGEHTLAQHIDRIAATPEARELSREAGKRVDPLIEEARDRVFGEYVEAPTYVGASDETGWEDAPAPPESQTQNLAAKPALEPEQPVVHAASAPQTASGTTTGERDPSTAGSTRLPGR